MSEITKEPAAIEPNPSEHEIQGPTRLSRSILWDLQRRFFDGQGLDAWNGGGVPSYITCNPRIALSYVRVLLGFMRDLRSPDSPFGPIDPARPVNVIELGTGSGRFSYPLLRRLAVAAQELPACTAPRIRYIMTDFTDANVSAWRDMDAFKPFVDQGLLDFARFDAEHDESLTLAVSGEVLSPATVTNPIVVVANYLFDTIVHDAFVMKAGALHENRVRVLAPKPADELVKDAAAISAVRLEWEAVPAFLPYYDDPAWDAVLDHYRTRMGDGGVLVPIGGFRCLRNLSRLSGDRLLVVSSDKGWNLEDELNGQGDPGMATHGSFSFMVNYHAMRQLFVNAGGFALHTTRRDSSLRTSVFSSRGVPMRMPETRLAFREDFEEFGPCDYYDLSRSVQRDAPAPSLDLVIDLIRLGGYDPMVLGSFRDTVLKSIEGATDAQKIELRRAADRLWDNHLPSKGAADLAFELARILYEMRRLQDSLRFNRLSLETAGDHHVTWYNMGLCHYRLEDPQEALRCFDRSLALNPDYPAARSWKVKVQGEIDKNG